jgi:cytochrome c-type biogenesis protein CcmE
MTRKQKRALIIGSGVGTLALAAGLVLFALRQEIVFFNTPTDLKAGVHAPGTRIRLGGLVENGSWKKADGARNDFIVTDTESTVNVVYVGILPDLFREGQGVVAEGTFGQDGVFTADSVLAKHDENYMPKEVADALKEKGVWQGGEAKAN